MASDTNMPDLLPDAVLFALYDIRKAGQSEGHPMHVGSHEGDTAIADAITVILEYEDEVRAAERARVVALVQAVGAWKEHRARTGDGLREKALAVIAAYDALTPTADGEG